MTPPVRCPHGNMMGDLKDCLPCYLEASLDRERRENVRLQSKLEEANILAKQYLVELTTLKLERKEGIE